MKRVQLTVILLAALFTTTKAQEGLQNADDHMLMFHDNYYIKDYVEAIKSLEWLRENNVELEEKFYAKGATAYDKVIKTEKDAAKSVEMKASALKLIEDRMEKFGQTPKVTNQYLTSSYKYWVKDRSKYEVLNSRFKSYVDADLANISQYNLLGYFDIMRRAEAVGIDVDDEYVLETYAKVSDKFHTEGDERGYIDKIDKLLGTILVFDCDKLAQVFGDKIVDDVNEVDKAKMYMNLFLSQDCDETELSLKAMDVVLKYEPTYSLALYSAKKAMIDKRLGDAEKYLGMALGQASNKDEEGEVYYQLASTMVLKNKKLEARKYALKATGTNKKDEANSLIGNLYMSSFSECVGEKDIIERRAVFIAAYNRFKMANDKKNMAVAKENFPTMEEIHMNNYSLGQKITVSCWFVEEVELMKREG